MMEGERRSKERVRRRGGRERKRSEEREPGAVDGGEGEEVSEHQEEEPGW